jgi:hypothetical protein
MSTRDAETKDLCHVVAHRRRQGQPPEWADPPPNVQLGSVGGVARICCSKGHSLTMDEHLISRVQQRAVPGLKRPAQPSERRASGSSAVCRAASAGLHDRTFKNLLGEAIPTRFWRCPVRGGRRFIRGTWRRAGDPDQVNHGVYELAHYARTLAVVLLAGTPPERCRTRLAGTWRPDEA